MSMANQNNVKTNIFTWIEENLYPKSSTSEEFIYNDLESQSGFGLPIIYQPFDGGKKFHWDDRGRLYDFLYGTDGEGKRLLDFGPGDGWPSLIVAPYTKEVIGLDASPRRVQVCTENAERLGITNVKFYNYTAGAKFPFEDNSFDGVMAASSIEQTPDPKETLKELYRVLKPGGRLRIYYEGLNRYQGEEQDIWIADTGDNTSKMILFNRNLEEEYVIQYAIKLALPEQEVVKILSKGAQVSFDQVTISFLKGIKDHIIETLVCKTVHPSGKTWVSWLKEIGFSQITPTHSGGTAAYRLYDQYSEDERPADLESIDHMVKKIVKIALQMKAPIELDPTITAVK